MKPLPELQMTLHVITPEKKVISAYFFAFPPVPAGGLNGWTSKNPFRPTIRRLIMAGLPVAEPQPF